MFLQILKQIGIVLLKFLVVIALLFSFYSAEIERHGVGIYVYPLIVAYGVIFLISCVCHVCIKEYSKAYYIAAIIVPIPFCVFGFILSLRDPQSMKWFPLAAIFIAIFTEVILWTVSSSVKNIIEEIRNP